MAPTPPIAGPPYAAFPHPKSTSPKSARVTSETRKDRTTVKWGRPRSTSRSASERIGFDVSFPAVAPPLALMMQIIRTSSSGDGRSAAVRHRHRQAVTISNRDRWRRCGGRRARRAASSRGPKKTDRWTCSEKGTMTPCHLPDGVHKLHQSRRVCHRVVEQDGDGEPAAEQTGHLEKQHVAELFQADVGVGLPEQDTLSGAVHAELPAGPLPEPAGERVVVDQCSRKAIPDGHGRVLADHAGVLPVELDHGDEESQALLVVDVGEPLDLARGGRCRADELRVAPSNGEDQ
ncbi:unnamed protein product [Spirodela intermedia]|uniref:Uncharacterized protein n=1 Tax=Spirodela intermedia TaxID=51605 RepID=A0A7I8LB19_SPIIN|nr:unnamed protein product [Spirodela intermedia]